MKRISTTLSAFFIGLSLLLVTACGNKKAELTTNSDKMVAQTKETTTKNKMSSKDETSKSSVTTTSENEQVTNQENNPPMNLDQIAMGNYSSVKGTWYEIGSSRNHVPGKTGTQYESGGTGTLSISDNEISSLGVSISNNELTDQNGEHELHFKKDDGVLIGTLVNQSTSINWAVSFYPVGTTFMFPGKDSEEQITQDTIVIWTSNNNYTVAYTQQEEPSSQNTNASLNLDQLENNDFTSLVGSWKNNATGDVLVVTGETQDRPEGSNVSSEKGAIIEGSERDGYPSVITSGSITDGYIQGGVGTFNPNIKFSSFSPIIIIPANVPYTDSDQTDITKDRLIKGGIQSDISQNTYYRE